MTLPSLPITLSSLPTKIFGEDDFPQLDVSRVSQAFGSTHLKVMAPEASFEVPKDYISVLQEVDKSIVRDKTLYEAFQYGGFYLNGVPVGGECSLIGPAKVEYFKPHRSPAVALSSAPRFREEWIVYRDEVLLIIAKPSRLATLPAKEQKHRSVRTYLEQFLGQKVHCPSRLDLSTAGLIVVSVNSAYHSKVQSLFERRQVVKAYIFASLSDALREPVLVRSKIARHPDQTALRRTSHQSGDDAATVVIPLRKRDLLSLYIALPLTGRTHQIRVHSAALKIPVLGDNFYGGSPAARLHLVSAGVGFLHPFSGAWSSHVLTVSLLPSWLTEDELRDVQTLVSRPFS
jgi:23S rRNA-/tRNA-specific pseudouridylate synthase